MEDMPASDAPVRALRTPSVRGLTRMRTPHPLTESDLRVVARFNPQVNRQPNGWRERLRNDDAGNVLSRLATGNAVLRKTTLVPGHCRRPKPGQL